ncbi:hypothetical protein LEAN103870_08145 [Legionella anisa]|uniref:Uncharacterized protein n=1 Tax=Legionella anisa TaxID=28082 RepID=A0AAX0WP61_9GAMM|nr:hypothetical protein [Legionella anisa]AWN73203.1 hypothetical protein DLD14_04745 [Legionella anisa]KTC69478.1 hypothetical protein Lani_2667 [Legionella anisa]MBN5934781.1 hypothetical protein [Legionella anisa]MCW8424039.1 hypothetical protein [Legionella anisa]MCW8447564.1 hypothetical protein [Legionella anisa]
MTKLEELLYSLTAVVVRYHDSQPKVKKLVVATDENLLKEKSLSCAKEIIQNQDIHFKIRLNDLIKQCSDSGRRPFLYYILHEITSLKELFDQKTSFEPSKLKENKNQISQLLIDLKLLLDTPKHKTYRITYSRPEETKKATLDLSGLKNDGYIGSDLCNSGEILNDEVLKRFNICAYTSNERIRDIAEQICMEHQHALLVPELIAQNELQKRINLEQEHELHSLTNQQAENQKKLETTSTKHYTALYIFYILFKRLQAREQKQKTVIDQQQETISELQQKISELTHPADSKPTSYRFYPSY